MYAEEYCLTDSREEIQPLRLPVTRGAHATWQPSFTANVTTVRRNKVPRLRVPVGCIRGRVRDLQGPLGTLHAAKTSPRGVAMGRSFSVTDRPHSRSRNAGKPEAATQPNPTNKTEIPRSHATERRERESERRAAVPAPGRAQRSSSSPLTKPQTQQRRQKHVAPHIGGERTRCTLASPTAAQPAT